MTENTVILSVEGAVDAPDWLDKLFVHKCLQNYFPEKQIFIHSFEVKPGTSKGENFASYIYRVTVVFSDSRQESVSGNVSGGRKAKTKHNSPRKMCQILF